MRLVVAQTARLQAVLRDFAPDVVHLASPFVLGWQGLKAAERLGIPSPVNAKVVEVVHEIEDGKRGMGWENLDVLEAAIPVT